MAGSNLSAFIWSVAELLRDDYKKSDYGQVILPFTLLRRIDCVLINTKAAALKNSYNINPKSFLRNESAGVSYSDSKIGFKHFLCNEGSLREHLQYYVNAFKSEVKEIFDSFDFERHIDRLQKANLLYLITERFSQVDLHPNTVSNQQMGMIFEELIRKFAESSNGTFGAHFTPREVIHLMVNLLFINDEQILTKENAVRTIYDPAAGTGGMLSMANDHIRSINPSARLIMSGQEINPESYAICKADMLLKGQDINNICLGNTISNDCHTKRTYDYMLSNPPFGVDWRKIQREVTTEHQAKGFSGRFGPGLPRVSDGSFLFLLHLISKMRPIDQGGSRFGIIMNGSPMFTGGATSGESNIRRYVFENDLVEAIIQLPHNLFYNTGISTYIWVVTNKKEPIRKGKVQLIDSSSFARKLGTSLGYKRQKLSNENIAKITTIYKSFEQTKQEGKFISRILYNQDFGYRAITIDRPEKATSGEIVLIKKGKRRGSPKANKDLRDTENIPLSETIESYFDREVKPYYPDAWIDDENIQIGYQILFNRYFYQDVKTKSLKEIDKEIHDLTKIISKMIQNI